MKHAMFRPQQHSFTFVCELPVASKVVGQPLDDKQLFRF